jgi:electron transfer flavoprotein alpha subunit
MSGVLAVAEARQGELRPISLQLAAAGRAIKADAGGRLILAIVDSSPERFASELAVDGVDEVVTITSPSEHFDALVHEQALSRLIESEQPAVVLTGMTIDALGFAPAVAATLELGFASDVTEIQWDEGPVAVRPDHGGKIDAELEFPGKDCTLLMLREGEFAPITEPGSAEARALDLDLDPSAAWTEHLDYVAAESEGDVDIEQAEFLLSVGRGIEDAGDVKQFEELAETMGATLASSRPLVDAGWVPNGRQVGQSGKTVSPRVYLAMGISGAVQHLAGIRGADTVIAINTDPEAPIFQAAGYGATADMFDVAEALAARFGD